MSAATNDGIGTRSKSMYYIEYWRCRQLPFAINAEDYRAATNGSGCSMSFGAIIRGGVDYDETQPNQRYPENRTRTQPNQPNRSANNPWASFWARLCRCESHEYAIHRPSQSRVRPTKSGSANEKRVCMLTVSARVSLHRNED